MAWIKELHVASLDIPCTALYNGPWEFHKMFEELNWDDERLEHIATHGVTIGEVLEVLEGIFWSPRWEGDKRRVYGQTQSGRYLFIVIGRRWSGDLWLVTARDMTIGERRLFLKKSKGARR